MSNNQNSKLKILIISFSLLLGFFGFAGRSLAAPDVTSTSGVFIQGGTVNITGSGFGTKSPADPLIWDNCESGVITDKWDEVLPDQAPDSNYNLQYRTAPYRNVSSPHSRSTRFASGGHYDYCGVPGPKYRKGPSVSLTKNITSDTIYASFYVRYDPNWPSCGPQENEKWDSHQTGQGAYTGGSIYLQYILHNGTGNICTGTSMRIGMLPASGVGWDENPNPEDENLKLVINPKTTWFKKEVLRYHGKSSDGWIEVYQNNHKSFEPRVNGTDNRANNAAWWTESSDPGSYSIGGYYRYDSCVQGGFSGHPNSWRYFDDIYVDITMARVVLANNQIYSNATIIEPQIPSNWSDTSITATVNLGRLLDGSTAYLFVFDTNNEHNSVGYPVTLGSSGGDTTPPAAPSGLQVQ